MTDEARASLERALPAYEIADRLGEGAFGVVYEARHTQLGRQVAIKQLPKIYAEDDHVRERFVAEAQMVASLDHPHIVPVYDFVESEGSRYLIMERCEGSIADRFKAEGIVTDEACAAVLACLAGLDVAHSRGLLHRDVKPENLMYDTKGVVKLADFGIARDTGADTRRTATGMIVGTPAYMSPEQCRGDDLTEASDVYSVGMMAYELLTGGLPFPDSDSVNGLLAHHLVTEPLPLLSARPELPGTIGEVIDRSLTKDLGERQSTAEQFASELATACVTAFGSGWLRRRRFILHWPEIIAVTEQPAPNSPRTGTIMVKAGELTHDFEVPEQPTTPARAVAAVAAPAVAPPSGDDAETNLASASPDSESGGGIPKPLIAIILGAVAALIVGVVLLSGGGDDNAAVTRNLPTPTAVTADDEVTAGATDTGDTTVDDAAGTDSGADTDASADADDDTTAAASADNSDDSTAASGDDATVDPEPTAIRFEPTEQPEGVDLTQVNFYGSARPCPENQERAACIYGISHDSDTDEFLILYWVEGFFPELEPADYHLHFYIDNVVEGDETKAGTETPGGSYRLWDVPFPAESFNGENGRTLFTGSEFLAADGRNLCVIVADPEQRAIPGSGNCVTPFISDSEIHIARFQASLNEGFYAGTCGLRVTGVIPRDWRWFDLTGDLAETARRVRPTAADLTEDLLELLVSQGGVIYADGPAGPEGFTPNVSYAIWEGDFTMNSRPGEVRDELAQLGIDIGEPGVRRLADREVYVGMVDNGNSMSVSYVIPDFGYAIAMTFTAPESQGLNQLADSMAATVLGC
ncbi:MAG: serine/threonine-protein kinase [Actinomycetota bacterium]